MIDERRIAQLHDVTIPCAGSKEKMTTSPAKTSSREWARIETLFAQAVLLPQHQRSAFIDEKAGKDPQVHRELAALLACDVSKTVGPLSRAVGSALVDVIHDHRRSLLGKTVGHYKLVAVLGEGGTGTVYLGERADHQYSARVAVKIVDHTAVNGSFAERFKAERQILATLNHPNIARLLDAGETDDGLPYIIMEHVQGEPLDEYCDRHRLDLHQRLRLFVDICGAVQYAHQNLVVHRDLKPANILVDHQGVPKLLDFGIAKLLPESNAARANMTRMNDRLLTPEYASPEQILGNNITTASDVYSLGVVLYQLLCGLRPYKVPVSASQLELERSICISDPERPSIALRHADEAEYPIAAIAAARSTSRERLTRLLVGDLDAIVLRSMRKEPQHRYGSVEQLANDLQHHLHHEPVNARQGNWIYYGQRFARRHTLGVAASSAFLIFVVGVAIVMSVQRQQIATALERATQQNQRAEMVSDFMLNVFRAADPFVHFGKEPTARNLLDQAAHRIDADLNQQPDVRARLLEAIGGSYLRMGYPDRAIPFLEESVQILEDLTTDDAEMGSVLAELAVAQREVARFADSDRNFSKALAILERAGSAPSAPRAQLLVDLGRLEMVRGNTQQSGEHFQAALELMIQLRGTRDPEVGATLIDLANVLLWENRLEEAERTIGRARDIFARAPELHPDRIMADSILAQILLSQRKAKEAAAMFEQVLAAQRFVYGSDNALVGDTLGNLANVRLSQKQFSAAERLAREALDVYAQIDSGAAHKIGYLQTTQGIALLKQRKFDEAETVLRETLELYATTLPQDHQYVASTEYYYGEALLGSQKLADAEAVLLASMNRWKRSDAPAWRAARSRNALGEALALQGRAAEGEQHLVEAYRVLSSDSGTDKEATEQARSRLERFYTSRAQRAKFDQLMQEQSAQVAGAR